MPQHETKKRKHNKISIDSSTTDHDDDEENIIDEDQPMTVENRVFNNMTEVNRGLIHLNSNFLNVDYLYMLNHGEMVDEFVGNINLFLSNLQVLRKKLASERLNQDTLSCVYQFLDTPTIICTCQLVCKLWKEALNKASLTISLSFSKKKGKDIAIIKAMKNFSFARRITTLSISHPSLEAVKALTKTKRLKGVKKLELFHLGIRSIQQICTSKYLTPTSFNLYGECDSNLFSSNILSKVETFELSNYISGKKGIITKVNLKNMTKFSIERWNPNFAELFTVINQSPMLKQLDIKDSTFLTVGDVSFDCLEAISLTDCTCNKSSIAAFNSSLFPKLKKVTITRSNTNESDMGKQEVNGSALQDLTLIQVKINEFSPLTKSCKNLKNLILSSVTVDEIFDFSDYFSADTLSSIQSLKILYCEMPIIENVLKKPYFSNLQELAIDSYHISQDLYYEHLKECTTLTHLKSLALYPSNRVESERNQLLKAFPNATIVPYSNNSPSIFQF